MGYSDCKMKLIKFQITVAMKIALEFPLNRQW